MTDMQYTILHLGEPFPGLLCYACWFTSIVDTGTLNGSEPSLTLLTSVLFWQNVSNEKSLYLGQLNNTTCLMA